MFDVYDTTSVWIHDFVPHWSILHVGDGFSYIITIVQHITLAEYNGESKAITHYIPIT